MPFVGGVYTGLSNSFNNASTGAVIDPYAWNDLFTDIETAFNDVLALTSRSIFATIAALQAANVSALIDAVQVLGYYTAGDRGAAIYKRISAPSPTKIYHIQSADGAWWQLAMPIVNQYQFGAKDGWVQDDYAAFQGMCDYCAQVGATFHAVAGRHQTSAPIIAVPKPNPDWDYFYPKRGPTWTFDNNCVIRATAVINAVFQLGNHTYETVIRGGTITGGVFDQANKAARGVWSTFSNRVTIDKVQTIDIPANGCGIQIGTTTLNEFGTLDAGFEGIVKDCQVFGRIMNSGATRSGTSGIRYVNTTDNQTHYNAIMSVKIGIEADSTSGYDGKHAGNHFWNFDDASTYAFELYGDNKLSDNQVDGPFTYVGHMLGARNQVQGLKVNYGSISADVDNTAILWLLDGAGEVQMTGSGIKGTASKRIKQEVALTNGATADQYTKDATNRYYNVITLSPVNLGVAAKAHVTISGTTPTLANSSNVALISRLAAGDYALTLSQTIGASAVVNATASMSGGYAALTAMEVKASRTTTVVRITMVNAAGSNVDPDAFDVIVHG